MSFSRKIIVIDCGASRTALGIFSQPRGRLRLDRQVVEVFPAPVGPGDEWLERTRAAFPTLRARAGRGGPCILVLPGHAVLTKFLKVPRVKPDQRRKVIHFESEQNLPIALSELVWDSVIAAERETGLDVLLAASHLRKVESLCAAARAAGFEPRRVLPASLAALAAFRAGYDQPSRPSLVMNLGGRSTTFLLVEDGRFVLRTFASGMIRHVAGDPPGSAIGVAHRLAQELLRSMLFFRRQDKLADPEVVYLTGGGAGLAGLREALAERLKLPVENFDLSRTLAISSEAANENPIPAVPIELVGGAATQMRDGHSVVNLLPPLHRRQMERRRRLALAAAAVLLIALPAAALWSLRPAIQPQRPEGPASLERQAATVVAPQRLPIPEIAEPEPVLSAQEQASESVFGLELLGVKAEPYRLQLAGYLGGPDDYLAVFTSPGQSGTIIARSGGRLGTPGVELRKFEVKKMPVAHADPWAIFEMAAEATLYDESLGEDLILLTSRTPKFMRPQATLRVSPEGPESRVVSEGDDIREGDRVYRVDRIRLAPPEVIIARHGPGLAEPEIHVLHAMPDAERTVGTNASVRTASGLASMAR